VNIAVREPAQKPRADNTDSSREKRRKVYNERRAISQEFQKEGVPRHVRAGRIAVRFQRVSASMFVVCPSCGHEPWKWQTECPRCGTGLRP